MKFQTGPLKVAVGKEAEWFFLDATVPWRPVEKGAADWFPSFNDQRTKMEEMLAKGKPFVSWYHPLPSTIGGVVDADECEFDDACSAVLEFIEAEGPIDAIVAYHMGNQIAMRVAVLCRLSNKEVPWRVCIFFCPLIQLLQHHADAEKVKPLPMHCYHVDSELRGATSTPSFDVKTLPHGWYLNDEVLLHHDGELFPVTQPRAAEIYGQLAAALRRHCLGAPAAPQVAVADGQRPPASASSSAPRRFRPSSALPRQADAEHVGTISTSQLADMLLRRACCVADTRGRSSRAMRPMPGAQSEDIHQAALEHDEQRTTAELKKLRDSGRPVVVVSKHGAEDDNFCRTLVRHFAFRADQLRRLDGGVFAWLRWELEHRAQSDELKATLGLPASHLANVAAVHPEELAAMLEAESCLLVDVREPSEMRHRPFFGAARGLSLSSLQKKPQQAERSLAGLRGDGDGRPLVAVSVTGLRCPLYCSMLVKSFGFRAEQVGWLLGGIHGWADWEAEHPNVAKTLDAIYGATSRSRSSGHGAAERENSLSTIF